MTQPLIIGSGIAGLLTALHCAPRPVTLISRASLGEQTSSIWAQGGIAAALGADDSPHLHAQDTLAAGAGLCDAAIVDLVTKDAAFAIERLEKFGVQFDRAVNGAYRLGLEGAHSRRRIVHGAGDGTGANIIGALTRAVLATPSITVIENAVVTQLLRDAHGICGAVIERDGATEILATRAVVLATGGAGALWQHTTNPRGSWGFGLALAHDVGAPLADLEFMQFHPTAIDCGRDPMPLASEALRGEGALLVDAQGRTITDDPLAARDIVARAIWARISAGEKVFLDARMIANFAARFPAIMAHCRAADIDVQTQPIPIQPAAHYHMGGVVVDKNGASSVRGLYACGEVARTGLHGANRLASNSLLEAAVFGPRVAAHMLAQDMQPVTSNAGPVVLRSASADEVTQIRAIMTRDVGLVRSVAGLQRAVSELAPLAAQNAMGRAALLITEAALARRESIGAHKMSEVKNVAA